MKYWLLKSEPNLFSFSDLKLSNNSTDCWDGVRNYQARNYMRDDMKRGDKVLFYHSNCKEPGVEGVAEVTKEAYPDYTSFDTESRFYDPKSTKESPRWFMVDITWKEAFKKRVTLKIMKNTPELKNMKLLVKGQRLSIQPVTESEFMKIYEMGTCL